jgi:hypothetical protein
MQAGRTCRGRTEAAEACRAPARRQSLFCLFHDPEMAEVVQEGRRAGDQLRRRESVLSAALDFDGLDTVAHLRRLLEIATYDTLALEDSVNRTRVIIAAAQAAAKLLETGELEALEAALAPRTMPSAAARRRKTWP